MESLAADAFDAPPSQYPSQMSGAGAMEFDNFNGNAIPTGPFVKVDGKSFLVA